MSTATQIEHDSGTSLASDRCGGEHACAPSIHAALRSTTERCREVERLAGELASLSETLEHEFVALAEEAGRLKASLAPHRQQRVGP
jgi:hypothetical protein